MDKIYKLTILFFIGLNILNLGINGPGLVFSQTGEISSEQIEGRVNPFLTPKEEKAMVELGNALPLDYLQVSAIFYSGSPSQSRVIIDGKVLVLGDSIDNKEIIKINPEDVVLEDSQGHYVAKMAGVMAKTAKLE
ncbi:MAG: hypothetical protein NTY14_07140 [Candidatus Omnitrophica bacterium]|nr:hypothetical protein [Candidatus Omnitrophota bacterium]